MSALVERIHAAQDDYIVVAKDPKYGVDEEYLLIGLLPEDVEQILRVLAQADAS